MSLSRRHESTTSSGQRKKDSGSYRSSQDDGEPFSSKYGGLDDATEDREKAPEHGQSKKGKGQVSTLTETRPLLSFPAQQSIAKIVPNAPKVKLEPVAGAIRRRRRRSADEGQEGKKHASHSDLPNGSLGQWQSLLMPAWKNYAASVENVWDTSDDALCDELQDLWDLVFPHIPWVVRTDEPVYLLVSPATHVLSRH